VKGQKMTSKNFRQNLPATAPAWAGNQRLCASSYQTLGRSIEKIRMPDGHRGIGWIRKEPQRPNHSHPQETVSQPSAQAPGWPWRRQDEEGPSDDRTGPEWIPPPTTSCCGVLPLTTNKYPASIHVTSEESFWPILHSFPSHFSVDNSDWCIL